MQGQNSHEIVEDIERTYQLVTVAKSVCRVLAEGDISFPKLESNSKNK
jgi:hypothetical protein